MKFTTSRIPKDWKIIVSVYLIATAIFYGYYIFFKPGKMEEVYKSWDGPSYTLTALSLYRPEIAYRNNYILSVDIHPDWTWLPAHFPLYPLLIRIFSPLGYFQAMLLISQLATIATLIIFYELIKTGRLSKHPLYLTLPMIFLPPRWFIVSHVGSSEQIFIAFLLLTLLMLKKQKYLSSAVAASLAQLTRSQGSLLVIGIGMYAIWEMISSGIKLKDQLRKYLPFLLVPASLFAVFTFYKIQTGDFFAFFSAIKLFKSTSATPFSVFTYPNPNIETFWQEVNAYNYVFYLSSVLILFKKKIFLLAFPALIFFLPLPFLMHSDISRYALPLMPMAFVAFEEILSKREITFATLLMSPAVMAYAANFMHFNRAL